MLRKNNTIDEETIKTIRTIKSIVHYEDYSVSDVVRYERNEEMDIFLEASQAYRKLVVGLRYMTIAPYSEESDDYEEEQSEYGIIDDPVIIEKIKNNVNESSNLVKEALKEILRLPKNFCKYYSLFFVGKIKKFINKGLLDDYLGLLVSSGFLKEGEEMAFVDKIRSDLQLEHDKKSEKLEEKTDEMYEWYEDHMDFINDVENGTLDSEEEKRKIRLHEKDQFQEMDSEDYYTYEELMEIMHSRYKNKSPKRDNVPNNIIKFPTGGKKR